MTREEAIKYLEAIGLSDWNDDDLLELMSPQASAADQPHGADDTEDVALEKWLEEYEAAGGARF